MKVLVNVAAVLAVISTPALARNADHSKHVHYHHRYSVAVEDARQSFGMGFVTMSSGWDARGRAIGATSSAAEQGQYEAMVVRHAAANGVPVSLVHRVIMRESLYNP